MKTKLKYFISSILFLPFLTKAQFIEEKISKEAVLPENFSGANASITGVTDIINILLFIIIIVSFFGFAISSVLLFTAGGDEEVLRKGRMTALFSLVGLCVALAGYIILKIIKYLFLI